MKIDDKRILLENILRSLQSVLIGFSGGVDSTLLLQIGIEVLGRENILPVTIRSEVNTDEEIAAAIKLAESMGAEHLVLPISDLNCELFVSNPPDRCYHCKKHHYTVLLRLAQEKNLAHVIDGSNYSDLEDYRPGARALQELGIKTPLQEAMLTKEDIRKLSRQYGLPTWNQPARPCLATRIPYGTSITAPTLRRIARAEAVLHSNGFAHCRVRHHDTLARIELPQDHLARLLNDNSLEAIITGIKAAGYTYVTLDLEGYRMGSLNEKK